MIKGPDGCNLTPFELKHRQVEVLEEIAKSLQVLASEGYEAQEQRAHAAEQQVKKLEEEIWRLKRPQSTDKYE